MDRPSTTVDRPSTTVDQSSAGRTSLDQAETPDTAPLGEGVTEADGRGRVLQDGGTVVQNAAFRSRVLPDEELARLGLVKASDV